jgi:arsenite-transporting ATPase
MVPFVFIGGKGGVGKTTVATAYVSKCAREGVDTLVVSTDPAHSLSDVFEQQFTDDPHHVEGFDSLSAMEIDPDEEVEAHIQEIKRTMNDQVSAGIVNEIDRQIELAHQTPGAYEAALFDRFIDVMRTAEDYDRIVFDTSPTGGTLRLLSLPDALDDWIDRLIEKRAQSIELFEKAAIGEREAREKAEDDPVITRFQERKEMFTFAGETLSNDAAFFFVLNPDELSIRETRRAIDELADYDLSVDGLIVNELTPEPADDEQGPGVQYLRKRYQTERDRIEHIRDEFIEPVVAMIERRVEEVKGDLLAEVAAELDIDVEAAAPDTGT